MEIFFVGIMSGVCAVIGGIIGDRKDAGLAGVMWGMFLGPLGVLIAALVLKLRCPHCNGRLNGKPSRCQHCAQEISWAQKEKARLSRKNHDLRY